MNNDIGFWPKPTLGLGILSGWYKGSLPRSMEIGFEKVLLNWFVIGTI